MPASPWQAAQALAFSWIASGSAAPAGADTMAARIAAAKSAARQIPDSLSRPERAVFGSRSGGIVWQRPRATASRSLHFAGTPQGVPATVGMTVKRKAPTAALLLIRDLVDRAGPVV